MSRKRRQGRGNPKVNASRAAALAERATVVESKARIAEAKAKLRRMGLEELGDRSSSSRRAMESWLINGQEIINRADYLPAGYGLDNGYIMGRATGLWQSTNNNRYQGADWPFIQTDQDIAAARGMARYLTGSNAVAVGVKTNLEDYVVRDGCVVSVSAKKNAGKVPDGMINAVQDVLDDFGALNGWKCNKEVETFWRGHRDGEVFLTLYPDKEGRTRLRFTEPEQVMTPPSAPFTEAELLQQFGINVPYATNWNFGVHTADHDVECVYGYSVQFAPDDPWVYLPASNVIHWKLNVDSNVKRGITDFLPAWEWLIQQARLLRNTGEGASQLAAIAYIVQHSMASSDQVSTMRQENADASWTVRTANGGTKTIYRENVEPGSRFDVPKGQEYLPGPAGHERGTAFLQVVQGILRQVGTRWCMTEGMISGDDSNNNMASMAEAGGRWHTYCQSQQGRFVTVLLDLFWRVLFFAFRCGRFERFGYGKGGKTWAELKRDIVVKVDPPDIDPKTRLSRTTHRKILAEANVLSRKSWQVAEALDPEEEDGNIERDKHPIRPDPSAGGQGGMPGMPGMPGVGEEPAQPGAEGDAPTGTEQERLFPSDADSKGGKLAESAHSRATAPPASGGAVPTLGGTGNAPPGVTLPPPALPLVSKPVTSGRWITEHGYPVYLRA